jgi:hypothetical protein
MMVLSKYHYFLSCVTSDLSYRYFIYVPKQWDRVAGPRPIIFLHGLGLGLLQYNLFITHLLENFPDHPVLVPLPPQISQNIFHPKFLKPFSRRQMVDLLTGLLGNLGWLHPAPNCNEDTLNGEDKITEPSPGRNPAGVIVISHSK